MSFGNNPEDHGVRGEYERRMAQAEAGRAAHEAGYKSPLRRLIARLRPHLRERGAHRRDPGGDPQSDYGTSDDPGH